MSLFVLGLNEIYTTLLDLCYLNYGMEEKIGKNKQKINTTINKQINK